MNKTYCQLQNGITIDRYDEGALITMEGSENVICLGTFEDELLKIALEYEISEAICILEKEYEGEHIGRDFLEFCECLVTRGVLQKND